MKILPLRPPPPPRPPPGAGLSAARCLGHGRQLVGRWAREPRRHRQAGLRAELGRGLGRGSAECPDHQPEPGEMRGGEDTQLQPILYSSWRWNAAFLAEAGTAPMYLLSQARCLEHIYS